MTIRTFTCPDHGTVEIIDDALPADFCPACNELEAEPRHEAIPETGGGDEYRDADGEIVAEDPSPGSADA